MQISTKFVRDFVYSFLIMTRILAIFIFCLVSATSIYADSKIFTVVIDAGHGGKDPGAIGPGRTREKDVNLAVALNLGKLIESKHKDVKVLYTRKTDVFIPLIERTLLANKNNADLFISIHADAVAKSSASRVYGTSTFTLGTAKNQENLEIAKRENAVILLEDNYETSYQGFDPNSAESYIMFETLQLTHQSQSIQFASYIQENMIGYAKRHDREVKQGPYLVLKTASMPAVLVETGFLSHPNEEKFLASTDGRQKVATAIYYGFKNYKEAFDRHNNVTLVNNPTPSTTTNKTSKVEYRVQFLSYHKELKKGDKRLKGLWPVSFYKEGTTYRYTYGASNDFTAITNVRKQIESKFSDAFVIRYSNGTRVK